MCRANNNIGPKSDTKEYYMPEPEIKISDISPDSPCEHQLEFWKSECKRLMGVYERNSDLARENDQLNSRLLEMEDTLEGVKDYLRLVREERDTLRWRLESANKPSTRE